MTEAWRRIALICSIVEPSANKPWVVCCNFASVQSAAKTSTRLEAPPEIKNNKGASVGKACK